MLFDNKPNLTGNRKTNLTGKETIKLFKDKQYFMKDYRLNDTVCKAMFFDGVNEDFLITPSSNFNFNWTDSFSIALWIYPTYDTPTSTFPGISKFSWLTPRGWFFTVANHLSPALPSRLRFQLRADSSPNYLSVSSNLPVSMDQWNHIAVTYDGSGTDAGVTFYINGLASIKPNFPDPGSSSISSGSILTSEPVTIGSIPSIPRYARDYIESARVWSLQLSANDIKDLYSRTTVPRPSALLLDVDFTKGTYDGTTWTIPDKTSLNTVVSRNMEADDLKIVPICPGTVVCKSLDFDGINEYLNCTNNTAFDFDYGDSFSIETWVKFDDLSSFSFLVSKWLTTVVSPQDADAYFTGTNGNKFTFRMFNSGGAAEGIIVDSNISLFTGTWYHLVATYDGTDGSGVNLYVNNISDSTVLRSNPVGTVVNTEPLQIGGQYTYFTNGQIAKVRVWSAELTPIEVSTMWNGGKIQENPVQSASLVLDTSISFASYATDVSNQFYQVPDLSGTVALITSTNIEQIDLLTECP
jgi:hypothetical protein